MTAKTALPPLMLALVKAQNDYNSTEFSALFATSATVYDEGKTYRGPIEIKQWNEATNEMYRAMLEPTAYLTHENGGILTALVSGNFAGSPVSLHYRFTVENEKINTLIINP